MSGTQAQTDEVRGGAVENEASFPFSAHTLTILTAVAAIAAAAASRSIVAAVVLWATLTAVIVAKATQVPYRYLAPITAFAISPSLPGSARLALEGALTVLAVVLALGGMARRTGVVALNALTVLITIFWLVLTTHPNVATLSAGLLGFRKSAMFFLMLTVGLNLFGGYAVRIGQAVALVLASLAGLTILIHLLSPEVEQSVSRAADRYTALFAGDLRLQGLLPGPFHVALMGSVLAVYGLIGALARRSGGYLTLGVLGLAVVQQTQVRSAFVAVGVGILIVPALLRSGPDHSSRLVRRLRMATPLLVFSVAAVLFVAGDPAATSIGAANDDSRLAGRWDTWRKALDLFDRSPLFGWGAGSAGDTMSRYFPDGNYVTSHNAALKYLVEGGLLGAGLVLGFTCLTIQTVRRSGSIRSSSNISAAALVGITVMGLTGAILEANPVAGLLAIGIGAESQIRSPRT